MPYLTTYLQRQVNDIWRKKIETADAQMRLYTTGKEIREFLNDKKTLCTAGYVIRRHLQATEPLLLEKIKDATGISFSDLSNNLNVAWDKEYVTVLAKELQQISKSRGIKIARNTWISYLDDSPVKMYKDTPFKVAFALKMSVETTEDLLMACGQDTYCFRNPEHFIYYYCQLRPGIFNWSHAQELIKRYRDISGQNIYNATDASPGMTNVLRTNLKKIFSAPVSDHNADDNLIEYMALNKKEFSGLSLTAREDFLRMSKYLSVLYPTYMRVVSRKNSLTGETEDYTDELNVQIQEDGFPNLSDLVRSLFSTGGWLPTTVGKSAENSHRTFSSIKRRESSANIEYKRAPINEEKDRPFLTSIQYFVDSYGHHLDAIERVFRRPANPGSVERRDVILFTYFFIRKYPELLQDEDDYEKELDQLTSLTFGEYRIDLIMDSLMEELYFLNQKKKEEISKGVYDSGANTVSYLDIFNTVLKHFGMKSMYMPNPWDRFITMSLFAEDPDFFTEAVLWNTVGDEYDTFSENDEEEAPPTEKLNLPYSNIIIDDPFILPAVNDKENGISYCKASLFRIKTKEYININKCCFVFGRAIKSNNSFFQDYGFDTENKTVSRCHAVILFDTTKFYLADISKRSETWLNEYHLLTSEFNLSPYDPLHIQYAYELNSGDTIRIGNESFIFRC